MKPYSAPHAVKDSMLPVVAVAVGLACGLALTLAAAGTVAQTSAPPQSYLPHLGKSVALTPHGSTPFGCETGVQAQSLSAEDAMDVTIAYYPQDGGVPVGRSSASVSPLGSAMFYLPAMRDLADGIYAGIVSADQPVASVARTDCLSHGKAAMYGQAEPGLEVLVPLVVADYFGQCSILSVQNPSTDGSVEAEIELYEVGAWGPEATLPASIGPGMSVTLDLCEFVLPGLARLRQFVGSARITAGANEIAVQAYVDIVNSEKALYAFNGVPTDEAATELYVPLFRSRQRMRAWDQASSAMDTGIAVVNPGDQPTHVMVMYRGAVGNAACGGQEYDQGPFTIPARSSAVFYQGPARQPVTGMHPLPEGCVGSARIVAYPEPVMAIVNDTLNFTEESAAYNAMTAEDAGRTVVLPLFRAGHTAWNIVTGVSAMNVGNAPADITIEAVSASGRPGDTVTATVADVAVGQTALFWPPEFANRGSWWDPANSYGSATVTSDQPIVVIVNDVSLAGAMDAATYNGIKAD